MRSMAYVFRTLLMGTTLFASGMTFAADSMLGGIGGMTPDLTPTQEAWILDGAALGGTAAVAAGSAGFLGSTVQGSINGILDTVVWSGEGAAATSAAAGTSVLPAGTYVGAAGQIINAQGEVVATGLTSVASTTAETAGSAVSAGSSAAAETAASAVSAGSSTTAGTAGGAVSAGSSAAAETTAETVGSLTLANLLVLAPTEWVFIIPNTIKIIQAVAANAKIATYGLNRNANLGPSGALEDVEETIGASQTVYTAMANAPLALEGVVEADQMTDLTALRNVASETILLSEEVNKQSPYTQQQIETILSNQVQLQNQAAQAALATAKSAEVESTTYMGCANGVFDGKGCTTETAGRYERTQVAYITSANLRASLQALNIAERSSYEDTLRALLATSTEASQKAVEAMQELKLLTKTGG